MQGNYSRFLSSSMYLVICNNTQIASNYNENINIWKYIIYLKWNAQMTYKLVVSNRNNDSLYNFKPLFLFLNCWFSFHYPATNINKRSY